MFIVLLAISTALLAGSVLIYSEVKNAPIAEETPDGLRIVWCNDRSDARDVSCIWKVLGQDALPSAV